MLQANKRDHPVGQIFLIVPAFAFKAKEPLQQSTPYP